MCKQGMDIEVMLCKPREDGTMTVKIDACIAPLIQMLNDCGIQTVSSCCGHGKTSHSYIRIHPKYIMIQKFNEEFSVSLQLPYNKNMKIKDIECFA